jgi:hypothetical protein
MSSNLPDTKDSLTASRIAKTNLTTSGIVKPTEDEGGEGEAHPPPEPRAASFAEYINRRRREVAFGGEFPTPECFSDRDFATGKMVDVNATMFSKTGKRATSIDNVHLAFWPRVKTSPTTSGIVNSSRRENATEMKTALITPYRYVVRDTGEFAADLFTAPRSASMIQLYEAMERELDSIPEMFQFSRDELLSLHEEDRALREDVRESRVPPTTEARGPLAWARRKYKQWTA